MSERIKAIVTKFWMSDGPKLIEAEHCGKESQEPVMIRGGMNLWPEYFRKGDWQPTKRDATDDVLARYVKRKAALKRAMVSLDAKRDRALKMIEGMDIK